MSYKIITDSSANLTEEMIEQYDIDVIPLVFKIGEKEFYSYVKGEKTDIKQFYDRMRQGEVITTSLISMETCHDVFESNLKEGKDILYISFSSGLSGTYNAALMVAKELEKDYPERKIYVVDSLSGSLGEGLLVYYCAEQKRSGKSIDEVKDWLIENRLHSYHSFTVDNLFHLKRGGRISGTAALVGTALGVKPILHVDNEGKIVAASKVRSRKKSLTTIVDEMEKNCINPTEQIAFIAHGDCIDDALYVEKLVRERLNVKGVEINYADPVIGAHAGPGIVGLFFLGKKR